MSYNCSMVLCDSRRIRSFVMSLETITVLSNRYGADPAYVLAGGGNTSFKDDKFLYVKPSGVSLAAIKESDFVKMDREIVRSCFTLPEFADSAEREAKVKSLMAFAIVGEGRRPSVEAPMHEILPFTYVVHTHPALVNAMTCGNKGKEICAELFPDALWVDYCDPGFILAKVVFDQCCDYQKKSGKAPQVIFLQNHGVFVGADSADEIDALYAQMMSTLAGYCREQGVETDDIVPGEADIETVMQFAPQLRGYLRADRSGKPVTVTSCGAFTIPRGPLTPDHLVYAKAFGLVSENPGLAEVDAFAEKHSYVPRMVEIPGKAVFCAGKNRAGAATVQALALNGALIEKLSNAFGGVHYLTDAQREFIENWE
ncbi:MAG: hypothetical protein E7058_07150, partial [Lentisphaerae bacterium]|nr:hypothetical protein [Lentisphaerota bacterium]